MVEASARILIVDADSGDRGKLEQLLDGSGYDLFTATTVAEAKDILGTGQIDAVVLAPNLPDGNGLSLVWDLMIRGVLVFVVADAEDEGAAERAYASGATDCSYKPVAPREWVARLRKSVGERQRLQPEGPVSRLRLFHDELVCLLDDKIYQLTPHERDLIACLLEAPAHFASYEQVIRAIWGDNPVDRQHVRVLVAQARRKLEQSGGIPLIRTVLGKGLKLSL